MKFVLTVIITALSLVANASASRQLTPATGASVRGLPPGGGDHESHLGKDFGVGRPAIRKQVTRPGVALPEPLHLIPAATIPDLTDPKAVTDWFKDNLCLIDRTTGTNILYASEMDRWNLTHPDATGYELRERMFDEACRCSKDFIQAQIQRALLDIVDPQPILTALLQAVQKQCGRLDGEPSR